MKCAAVISLLLACPLFAQISQPPFKKLEMPNSSLYVNGDSLFIKDEGCIEDHVKALALEGGPQKRALNDLLLLHSAPKLNEFEGGMLFRESFIAAKPLTADEKQLTKPRVWVVPFAGLDDTVPHMVRFQEVWRGHAPHSYDYLAMSLRSAAAAEAHQPPAPADPRPAVQAALDREREAGQGTSAPGTNAPGAMVFIDPATGKMVQPTETQIGRLASHLDARPQGKAPIITIQGPGGAVGIVLTPESFSYSVATRTADGKLALDCVTGDQAADRMVSKESVNKLAPQAKGPIDEKH